MVSQVIPHINNYSLIQQPVIKIYLTPMLRQTFKFISPARTFIIPLMPRGGIPPSQKQYFMKGIVEIPMNKYKHLLISNAISNDEDDQLDKQEKQDQSAEVKFMIAKKFFTTLINHCPISTIIAILNAAQVYQKKIEADNVEKSWLRKKLRNRILVIFGKNSQNHIVEQIMQMFDKTSDEFLTHEFLKSHEAFIEINRASQQKKLKYNYCDNIYQFNQANSIINHQGLHFMNQNFQLKPIEPSEHFFFDDEDIKQLNENIQQQKDSLYSKLLMKSTYKQEQKKVVKPEEKKTVNKKKQFQKIILVNKNPEPLDVQYGQKWVYVYGLPYQLTQKQIKSVLNYSSQFGEIVNYKAYSYKEFLDVDENFLNIQGDEQYSPRPSLKITTQVRRKNIQQKLISRSITSLDKDITLNNSYMLIQFKNVSTIINNDARVFGIFYDDLHFKLQYAQYKKSLIAMGIPLGIDSNKLSMIVNGKLLQKDLRGLCLSPRKDQVVKNFNNYALLQFNSFWQSLKAMQALSTLRHNGVNLKLVHTYGGLRVLNGKYEQLFDEVQQKNKNEVAKDLTNNLIENISEKKNKIQVDIGV